MHCRITVKGHLDERWSDWFSGLSIRHLETGESALEGPIADQAALHGVLATLRDLHLALVAVACEDQGTAPVNQSGSEEEGHGMTDGVP